MGTANSATQSGTGTPAGSPIQIPAQQSQSSIVEPRPIVETSENEEMFLSPRVIDAGAFTRYSEMLKSIITQASTQGRSLEDFSADAEAMIKRCDATGDSINKRMQAGVRMLKMIDERATRTDLLLEKIQTALPDSQALASQIDEIIEQRLADSQQRMDAIVERAQAQVLAAETRATEALAQSEEHAAKLAKLSAKVDGQLSELDSRIENTRNETNNTLTQILDKTNAVSDELNTSIDCVLSRSQEAGANLAIKIDEASKLTDARILELNKSIEPVLEASQQAMRTLGMDPDNPVFEDSPLSRIEHLVERGETQSASLDRVYRQLEDLQSQAEGVKAVFGLWLVDAAEELDVLEARKDTLVGPMSEAADKIAQLGPDLEDKLELASTQLTHLQIEQKTLRQTIQASSTVASEVTGRMTNQSGQLQALLDGSLHKLSTRVEQAGVWLGALIQRAESLGASLPGAGKMDFGSPSIPAPMHDHSQSTTPAIMPITTQAATPTNEPALREESFDTLTDQSQDQIENRLAPEPPCLPIDALSFDGASIVIQHNQDSSDEE
jgi:ABC-type transporter Mla subunit MlaD